MLARYERECRSLTLREIHRFKMGCIARTVMSRDVDSTESAIRLGLNKVCEEGFVSIALGLIRGVDFVLLDQQGQRVGLPLLIAIAAPMA